MTACRLKHGGTGGLISRLDPSARFGMNPAMPAKKLYRIPEGKKISGVCSGLAEYFDVDPVLPRVLFIASLFFGGVGLIIYVLFHFMVPEQPASE